jgi:nucleoredoxin
MINQLSVAAWVMSVCLSFTVSAAAPPERLAVPDLANHPERWPDEITLKRDVEIGGGKGAKAGSKAKVIEFFGQDLGIDCGHDLLVAISPSAEDSDFVEVANKMWSALSPAQRAVDEAMLVDDASIWPDKVRAFEGFQLDGGKVLEANTEYDLLAVTREKQAILWYPEGKARLTTQLNRTDGISRAREKVAMEHDKRPARIADALKKNVVDADGKAIDDKQLSEARVFALYYGASWCGPCRAFSPGFVKYIDKVSKENPHLVTVMINGDDKDAEMFNYMKTEKMPWPAVKKATWFQLSGVLHTYYNGLIPQLVIVDPYGKLLADSYQNKNYVGPKRAMGELDRILKSGVAK